MDGAIKNSNQSAEMQVVDNSVDSPTKDSSIQQKPRKDLLMAITAIVFFVAEIGRFGSMGWGLFFTPGFAAMFIASCGCFVAFKNKRTIDYVVYAIICMLYLVWGYTWTDIPDYGEPTNFLTNLTGVDYRISSNISLSVMSICVIVEIIPIVRIITGSRPRQDLDKPWDKNRNIELGTVISVAVLLTLIIVIISLLNHSINTMVIFSIFNAIFAWGGICFANIKQKKVMEYWLFGGLCLTLGLAYVCFALINWVQALYMITLPLSMLAIVAVPVISMLLTFRRHFDKYGFGEA